MRVVLAHAASERERLFLLDGTALAYRSHFAFLRANLTDVHGRPTGAVYGFVATLLKLLREEKPHHIGVAFDPPGPTFRHERYAEYKATREKMDDDLVAQMPVLREVVRAFRVVNHECEREEDLVALGTTRDGTPAWLNRHAVEADLRIVTGFIEPHFFAGFSGGPKGLMPGVAGLRTVMSNHGYRNIGDSRATFGISCIRPIEPPGPAAFGRKWLSCSISASTSRAGRPCSSSARTTARATPSRCSSSSCGARSSRTARATNRLEDSIVAASRIGAGAMAASATPSGGAARKVSVGRGVPYSEPA